MGMFHQLDLSVSLLKVSVSQAVVRFIQHNFYVDDSLISVETKAEAIQLVKEARDCKLVMFHLQKFISNSNLVIAFLPRRVRGKFN